MRSLSLLVLVSVCSFGATVSYTPTSGDQSTALQNAVNSAGVNGTLTINSGTIAVNPSHPDGCGNYAVQLPAGITVKPNGAVAFTNTTSNSGYVFQTASDNVSITSGTNATAEFVFGADPRNPDGSATGTFESTGIGGWCLYAKSNAGHLMRNFKGIGWYAHDLYYGNSRGFYYVGIIDGLTHQHNWVYNSCRNGCQNVTSSTIYGTSNCPGTGECQWDGTGWEFEGGIANADISYNFVDWTGNDGMHANWGDALSNNWFHVSDHVYVHNNMFNRIQRISIEMQAVSSSCDGGCKSFSPGSDYQVYSNYDAVHFIPSSVMMSWSINNDYKVQQLLNNTSTQPNSTDLRQGSFYGNCFEVAISGGVFQGNVCAIDFQSRAGGNKGFGGYVSESTTGTGYTVNIQNNIMAGPEATIDHTTCYPATPYTANPCNVPSASNDCSHQIRYWQGEGCDGYIRPTLIFGSDYRAETAWNAGSLTNSNITTTLTSPNNQSFPNRGTGTWSGNVVSALSIDYVAFYVDNNTTPVAKQRIQDINTNFATNRQWLYHGSFDTGSLTSGSHTITMTARDVKGAKKSATQTFTVGTGGGSPPATPTGLALTVASSSEIDAACTTTTGITYSFYRSATSGFTPGSTNRIATGLAACSFADLGLSASTQYYYAVDATNSFGTSAPSALVSATTQSTGTPPPPVTCGYISNCDFQSFATDISPWAFFSNGTGGSATIDSTTSAYSGNSLKVTLGTLATQSANTQVYQNSVGTAGTLPSNKNVKITLRVKGSTARTGELALVNTGVTPATNIAEFTFPVTTAWTQYTSATFNTGPSDLANARLRLGFNYTNFQSGDIVEFDDVTMTVDTSGGGSTPITISGCTANLNEAGTCTLTANQTVNLAVSGVGALSCTSNCTSSVYTAPTHVAVQHQRGGCPVQPADSIFNTPVNGLPVNTSSAAWLASMAANEPGQGIVITPVFGLNVIDSTAPKRSYVFHYSTAYNNTTVFPYSPTTNYWREQGSATIDSVNDHHEQWLDHTTCQFSELYQTNVPGQCFGCTAASAWTFSGASDYALPANGAGTDAASLPLTPLVLHASDIRTGVNHPVRFTWPTGFNYSAVHQWPASTGNGSNPCTSSPGNFGTTCPQMGSWFRLKQSWITANLTSYSALAQNILRGYANYGLMLADNGTAGQIEADVDINNDQAALAAMNEVNAIGLAFDATNWEAVDPTPLLMSGTSEQIQIPNGFFTPTNYSVITATGPPTITTTTSTNTATPGFVQVTTGNNGTGSFVGSISTAAFGASVTQNNLIVVAVNGGGSATQTATITDTQGNVYTAVTPALVGGGQPIEWMFYAVAKTTGADTVTATFSGTVQFPFIEAAEYSGVATTNPLDQVATGSALGNAVSGNVTTTIDKDLAVAAGTRWGSAGQINGAGPGYIYRASGLEDQVLLPAGTYNAAFTSSGNTNGFVVILATFKPLVTTTITTTSTPSTLTPVLTKILTNPVTVGTPYPYMTVAAGSMQTGYQLQWWVNGATNQTVTWALTSGVGTVSATGSYVPPATATAVTTAVLTGTSAADTQATTTVFITVVPQGGGGAIRIDKASNTGFTDSNGNKWQPDTLSHQNGVIFNSGLDSTWGFTDDTAYRTYEHSYGDDLVDGPFIVANGNYLVTYYGGQGFCSGTYGNVTNALQTNLFYGQTILEANGNIGAFYDFGKPKSGTGAYLCRTGYATSIPATVTNNILTTAVRARADTDANHTMPEVNALAIQPDTQPAHISIDQQQVSNVAPGDSLQLFAVGWHMANPVTWSIVYGPGKISANGVYSAPTSPTSAGTAIRIRAISTVDPTKSATADLFLSGSTYILR
jgi:hypothetical protein